jgi:hypothetical protein
MLYACSVILFILKSTRIRQSRRERSQALFCVALFQPLDDHHLQAIMHKIKCQGNNSFIIKFIYHYCHTSEGWYPSF